MPEPREKLLPGTLDLTCISSSRRSSSAAQPSRVLAQPSAGPRGAGQIGESIRVLCAPGTGGGRALGLQRPSFENRWPPAVWLCTSTPEETRSPDCQLLSPPGTGKARAGPAAGLEGVPSGSGSLPSRQPVITDTGAGPPRGAEPDLGVAARPDPSSARPASGLGSGNPGAP